MTAHQSKEGNGALDVVRAFFDRGERPNAGLNEGDHFLACMWAAGFKVVPLAEADLGN